MTYTTNIDTDFFESLTKDQQRAYKRKFPSVFWIPNIAQERPSKRWYKLPYPRTHIVTFGNRTGKTEWLGEFLAGVTKGSKYVNRVYCYSPFFDELDKKRQAGDLTVWWVCDADMMKKGAPDYKIISKHIPDAMFKARTNNGVYKEIHIPIELENGKTIIMIVHVKTHDQETTSFTGENVDVMICDEPPPEKHWPEMSARIVPLHGESGGRIIIGGTPLKVGNFLLDLIEDSAVDNNIVHDEGSIWENCHGEELPDEMAVKYNIPKNPETGIYETRGHLSLEGIQNAILNWKKSGDPDEVVARVDGKFTHIQGRIYKIFDRDVHTIDPFPIPKKYPIIMICDPHDTRPDCAGYYMITPRNKLICIAEYPRLPFELLTSRSETIPQTCDSWRMIEAELGISDQIVAKFGDPNYMLDPDPYTNKTKQELYALNGYSFSVNITDNLQYGHEKVREFLYYDKIMWHDYKDDPSYQPRLIFFSNCRNHIVFMRKYSTKINKDYSKAISEQVDPKWKDYADLVRYAAVAFKPYETMEPKLSKAGSEWERIKKARDPYYSNQLINSRVF